MGPLLTLDIIRREAALVLSSRHIDEPISSIHRDLGVWASLKEDEYFQEIKFEFRGKYTVIEVPRGKLGLSLDEFSERYISPAMCALLPRLPEIC